MQYKNSKKLLIDQRKLESLFRLGCPDKQIIDLLKTGTFESTGDSLIDDMLESLIDYRVFENWGGTRTGAGRKSKKSAKKNQLENQDDNQDEKQLANQDANHLACQVVDKDIDKDKVISKILNSIGKDNKNCILIDSNFSCSKFDVFKVYIQNMPADIIKSVESWIKKEKNGQTVPVGFITKQFINFANRQNKPLFKGEQQCK